ncbi:hypothetical protein [Marivita geojedonensis]|uniref:Uncharacterized protein n=1 Tax=Marivita geojedonensis TaxID=1123756 RepID=A0A1X4NCY9_9RHOB|nr:hypothetical protein [Marivita geojedonensis]OSQ44679.1 hypothetical protein MGEO_18855 [Marivita geojedonensis]
MKSFIAIIVLLPVPALADAHKWGPLECEVVESAMLSFEAAIDRSSQLERALRGTDFANFQRIEGSLPPISEMDRSLELLQLLIEQNCR